MYTVKQSINFNQNDQVVLLIAFAAWCVWTFQTCQFLSYFGLFFLTTKEDILNPFQLSE